MDLAQLVYDGEQDVYGYKGIIVFPHEVRQAVASNTTLRWSDAIVVIADKHKDNPLRQYIKK